MDRSHAKCGARSEPSGGIGSQGLPRLPRSACGNWTRVRVKATSEQRSIRSGVAGAEQKLHLVGLKGLRRVLMVAASTARCSARTRAARATGTEGAPTTRRRRSPTRGQSARFGQPGARRHTRSRTADRCPVWIFVGMNVKRGLSGMS